MLYQVTVIETGDGWCRVARALDAEKDDMWPLSLEARYATAVRTVANTKGEPVGWSPSDDAVVYEVINCWGEWAELAVTRFPAYPYVGEPGAFGDQLWRAYG